MVGHAMQINVTQGTAAAEAQEYHLRVWCHWLVDQLPGPRLGELAHALMRVLGTQVRPLALRQLQFIGSASTATHQVPRTYGPTLTYAAAANYQPQFTYELAASETATTEGRFQTLLDEWRRDTAFSSSASEICEHPAYQQIIAMGATAVPLLLREVERGTGHLHEALALITGEDPVPEDDAGDEEAMAAAWLAWGRAHGHRW
jgi:hypothetical protein